MTDTPNLGSWIMRRVIDHHSFQRRGLSIDYTIDPQDIWSGIHQPNSNGQVVIELCFESEATLDSMFDIIGVAMARWEWTTKL